MRSSRESIGRNQMATPGYVALTESLIKKYINDTPTATIENNDEDFLTVEDNTIKTNENYSTYPIEAYYFKSNMETNMNSSDNTAATVGMVKDLYINASENLAEKFQDVNNQLENNYYDKETIDDKLVEIELSNTYNFYTKEEIDDKNDLIETNIANIKNNLQEQINTLNSNINDKVDNVFLSSNYYDKIEVDNKIPDDIDMSNYYTITDVDNNFVDKETYEEAIDSINEELETIKTIAKPFTHIASTRNTFSNYTLYFGPYQYMSSFTVEIEDETYTKNSFWNTFNISLTISDTSTNMTNEEITKCSLRVCPDPDNLDLNNEDSFYYFTIDEENNYISEIPIRQNLNNPIKLRIEAVLENPFTENKYFTVSNVLVKRQIYVATSLVDKYQLVNFQTLLPNFTTNLKSFIESIISSSSTITEIQNRLNSLENN